MRIFFVSRVNDLKNILAIGHKTSDIALFLSNTFKLEYLTLYQKNLRCQSIYIDPQNIKMFLQFLNLKPKETVFIYSSLDDWMSRRVYELINSHHTGNVTWTLYIDTVVSYRAITSVFILKLFTQRIFEKIKLSSYLPSIYATSLYVNRIVVRDRNSIEVIKQRNFTKRRTSVLVPPRLMLLRDLKHPKKRKGVVFILSAWAAHNDKEMEKWQYSKIFDLQKMCALRNLQFRVRLHPLQRSHISSQIGDQICDVLSDEEFFSKYEKYLSHSSTLLLDAFEAGCNCFRVCDGA